MHACMRDACCTGVEACAAASTKCEDSLLHLLLCSCDVHGVEHAARSWEEPIGKWPRCAQALVYYEGVRAERALSSPSLWDRIAACQQALGRGEGSADIYLSVIHGACLALLGPAVAPA